MNSERGVPWFGLIIGTCVVAAVILGVAGTWATRPAGELGPETAAEMEVADPAPRIPEASTPVPTRSDAPSPVDRVDQVWASGVATATGIPQRALLAYASADLALATQQPDCGVGWNTLAAIGWVESAHGFHDGSVLGGDGTVAPSIVGPRLNGGDVQAISDSDGGALDGDTEWDRALGPLQFIPSTWAEWGTDGNGDGVSDPNQIDDAALSAARYLCASGSLRDGEGWRSAILSYNGLESYVDSVAEAANFYAAVSGG